MLEQGSSATQFVFYIVAAVISGFCSLLLVVAGRRDRGMDPLTWWAISMALTAGGLLAAAVLWFEPATPRRLGADIAVGLLLLSAGASWMAARAFAGRRVMPVIALAGAVVWLGALFIPAFDQDAAAQMALPWGISAVYAAAVI